MEIFALIISIIASALLIRNFFLQERTKVLQNQVSDAHAMVHRLERRLIDQPDDTDYDEYEELKVGSRVEVAFGKFLVKGKIESIAAISASKKHGDQVGFSFRADNDKHSIWLSHDHEELWLDDDETTETAATPKTNELFEKLDTVTDALLKTASEAKAAGVPEEAISSAIASARGQDA